MSSSILDSRMFVGILFGLIASLIYCLSNPSSAQTLEKLPEATLDEQQIQDLRSILNGSIESLEKGNITEAITNLRIAEDQLRILGD